MSLAREFNALRAEHAKLQRRYEALDWEWRNMQGELRVARAQLLVWQPEIRLDRHGPQPECLTLAVRVSQEMLLLARDRKAVLDCIASDVRHKLTRWLAGERDEARA